MYRWLQLNIGNGVSVELLSNAHSVSTEQIDALFEYLAVWRKCVQKREAVEAAKKEAASQENKQTKQE